MWIIYDTVHTAKRNVIFTHISLPSFGICVRWLFSLFILAEHHLFLGCCFVGCMYAIAAVADTSTLVQLQLDSSVAMSIKCHFITASQCMYSTHNNCFLWAQARWATTPKTIQWNAVRKRHARCCCCGEQRWILLMMVFLFCCLPQQQCKIDQLKKAHLLTDAHISTLIQKNIYNKNNYAQNGAREKNFKSNWILCSLCVYNKISIDLFTWNNCWYIEHAFHCSLFIFLWNIRCTLHCKKQETANWHAHFLPLEIGVWLCWWLTETEKRVLRWAALIKSFLLPVVFVRSFVCLFIHLCVLFANFLFLLCNVRGSLLTIGKRSHCSNHAEYRY